MSTAVSEHKPIALVVEDERTRLRDRRKLFSQHGFQSVGAHNTREALREFRSTPTIDIVITDINLDDSDPQDKSGVELAKIIRERRPDIPLMALSGQFDDLDDQDKKVFDAWLLKGTFTVGELEKQLGEWRQEALDYRTTRAEKAREDLSRMKNDWPVPDPDVEVLRDFLPGAHAPGSEEDEDDGFLTPDEMLRREGWRLRLVQAGSPLSEFEESAVRTEAAIPFWLKNEDSVTIVVLHGHPCVYSSAPNEEQAVREALELMFGYHRELAEDDGELPAELTHLREYLRNVFGRNWCAGDEEGSGEDNAEIES